MKHNDTLDEVAELVGTKISEALEVLRAELAHLNSDNDGFGDRRARLMRASNRLGDAYAEVITYPRDPARGETRTPPTPPLAAQAAKRRGRPPRAAAAAETNTAAEAATTATRKKRRSKKATAATPAGGTGTSEDATSIETLKLSTRSFNALTKKRITTIDKLVNMTEEKLLNIPRFGKTCLADVRKRLKKIGLELGGAAQVATPSRKKRKKKVSNSAPAPTEEEEEEEEEEEPINPDELAGEPDTIGVEGDEEDEEEQERIVKVARNPNSMPVGPGGLPW